MKWKMHSRGKFTAEQDGYLITIEMRGFCNLPYWDITKDNVVVDSMLYHSCPFTNDELNAKVQAERSLNKILQSKNTNPIDLLIV